MAWFLEAEELVVTLAPVVVYWVYSGIYEVLLRRTTVLDKYRLHSTRDEETKNIASRKDVVKGVLLQQAIQVAISVAVLKVLEKVYLWPVHVDSQPSESLSSVTPVAQAASARTGQNKVKHVLEGTPETLYLPPPKLATLDPSTETGDTRFAKSTWQLKVVLALTSAVSSPPLRWSMLVTSGAAAGKRQQATARCTRLTGEKGGATTARTDEEPVLVAAGRFGVAMLVLDAWQYLMHRLMHSSTYMYRRFHSWHHRVAAPYAFAAQYGHPVDAVLTETLSGAAAYVASGMSPRTAAAFFVFATVKGVDDHCGVAAPWNPLHALFANNTAYHDVHHQRGGGRRNFSQPFFVVWDRVLGTHAAHDVVQRPGAGAGLEVRVVNKDKNQMRCYY
ncbi:hypothetical protein PR202_gb05315 [Eleusine coracana subsp. coracana]|uniref:aldehyde oxygenase (deformylating) n=1 Tax=Eleusine coracana subsp. coracana TaxID=191504 RepID=A0AAV5E7L0_ELECO|nr:hypothetical protein PR202_gb05315 [Eleusine coracana subsp. coracana]